MKRQRRYMVPSNYWMPRIPKSMKMNNIKATALRSESTEPMRDETSFLIFGKALILRRGRKTRSVLRARTLNQLRCIISSIPVTTTTVSSQFQASFKYAYLWIMRPWAKILSTISMAKKTVKTSPISSSLWFHSLSLSRSSYSYIVKMTVFRKMSRMMIFSKNVELVKLTSSFRNRFS